MAEQSYTDVVNGNLRVPSAANRAAVAAADTVHGTNSALATATDGKPFVVKLAPVTNPNNTTVDSHPFKVPFPCRLVIGDMNVRNLNGATATGDILLKRGAGAYTSQLNAAEALVVDTVKRVAPETTADSVEAEKDDLIIFRAIGTGAGEIVGAEVSLLFVQR